METLLSRAARRGSRLDRLTRAVVAGQLRTAFDQPGLVPVDTCDDGSVVASVLTDARPLVARRLALATVTAALESAAVPFFCVRGYSDHAGAVAVSAASRKAAISAIRRAATCTPLFVSAATGHRAQTPRTANSRTVWRELRDQPVIRVTQYVTDQEKNILLGREQGCDLEFWEQRKGRLHAPRPNRLTDVVPRTGDPVTLDESQFTRTVSAWTEDRIGYPTRVEFAGVVLDDITFPVDAVYTWVDGSDPAWQSRRDAALALYGTRLRRQAVNPSRYISHCELFYSMRSLHAYAPWIRHIWLVTDEQVPPWLDMSHPKVTVVSHKELFRDQTLLPTFNSHAIESQLHQIDGLSEHFLYFNDDVFLGRSLTPQHFFQANGITKLFPSKGKVEPGEVQLSDLPSTAAGKNNRRLIERDFGRHVTFKMKHVPHALRRSVLAEMTTRYPEELGRTAASRFRDSDDVSLTSSAYQYYAFATERAVLGRIASICADLASPATTSLLDQALARRDSDVFCLNDTDSDPETMQRQHQLMSRFLARYFPVAAPWEVDAGAPTPAAERPGRQGGQ